MSGGGGILHIINVTIMLIVWHKWKRCTGSLKVADLATSMETKQVCQKKRKKTTQILDREHQITVPLKYTMNEHQWSDIS